SEGSAAPLILAVFPRQEVAAVGVTAVKEDGAPSSLVNPSPIPFRLRPKGAAGRRELQVQQLLEIGRNSDGWDKRRTSRVSEAKERRLRLLPDHDGSPLGQSLGKRQPQMEQSLTVSFIDRSRGQLSCQADRTSVVCLKVVLIRSCLKDSQGESLRLVRVCPKEPEPPVASRVERVDRRSFQERKVVGPGCHLQTERLAVVPAAKFATVLHISQSEEHVPD